MEATGRFARIRRLSARSLRPWTSTLAASILVQATSALTGVLLARSLGPSGRGAVAAVFAYATAIQIFAAFGLPDAATFFTAARESTRWREQVWAVRRISAPAVLLAGVAGTLATLLLASTHELSGRAAGALGASSALGLYGQVMLAAANGLGRTRTFNIGRLLVPSATTVAVCYLAISGRLSTNNGLLAYALGNLTAGCVAMLITRRHGPWRAPEDAATRRSLRRRVLRYALPSHVSYVLLQLNTRIDQLVLAALVPSRTLGLYVVAYSVTAPLMLIGEAGSLQVLPRLARAPRTNRLSPRTLVLVTTALTISSIVYAALVVGAIIPLLFGDRFEESIPAARVLCIAAAMWSASRIFASALKGLGRPGVAARAELVGLAITGCGLPVALRYDLLLGPAWVSVGAYTVAMLLNGIAVARLGPAPHIAGRASVAKPALDID